MELQSVAKEREACKAVWRTVEGVADAGWHLHHEELWEDLGYTDTYAKKWKSGIWSRIQYVNCNKHYKERALRFHLMRPMSPEARAALHKATEKYLRYEDKENERYFKEIDNHYANNTYSEKVGQQLTKESEERLRKNRKVIIDLQEKWHKKECYEDCPWNGKTIFAGEYSNPWN